MPENSESKELAALDAIIAAALAGLRIEDLSDDEIIHLSDACPPLSPEGRMILESLGSTPFSSHQPEKGEISTHEVRCAGMYRESSDEVIDPNVKAEIDRKREEIRARLKATGKQDV